jgi:phosphoenolpyruvate carboxylase
MKSNSDFRDRLRVLHKLTAETPLFNPVFQLSLDVSREIEDGRLDLAAISPLISDLECEALQSRANKLNDLLAPVAIEANLERFRAAVLASTSDGFEAFKARWARPFLHVVYTAHPTFLLTAAQSDAVAVAASSGDVSEATVCMVDGAREAITLDTEHDEAMAAMSRAADARAALTQVIFEVASQHWPDRWQGVQPMPFRLASWVGYDMDGRTDISWSTSIRYRLSEKAERLEGYVAQLGAIQSNNETTALLAAAAAHTRAMEAIFAGDVSSPDTLSAAANRMTADDPAKLISLAPIIAALESDAADSDQTKAIAMLTLAAAMRADGLGMGWIHFRVNAAQLHNAIRRRIDPDNTLDLGSRTALQRMRKLLAEVKPLRSNFAALAIEDTTALRQFLAMAQILHHIDGDAPIRMLIAECEEPQTVLAALYFARLFGIEGKVDVSPLFETESAMEHGSRFLEALIAEPDYQAYARGRGRVAIQTGFSDAGRFVGQLPAALAIERLHAGLARAMAKHGLTTVAALIFNTHGESMGRGAHPSDMVDRLRYPMTQWARGQFASRGIRIEIEASFQGGDGYLFFRTPELALATLTRIVEAEMLPLPEGDDPFYSRTDVSLDFYRGIRRVQRDHLASRTYARAITAFGLGLLNETGSRKSRRQSDMAADREMNLRQIRAIPHNAVLQQLGYPVNVIAGVGTAAGEDVEGVADMINASARGKALFRMLRASNALASIKSVAAYGELFNSAYWASRPYRGTETRLEPACLALAERLTSDDRTGVFRRLASRLRVDAMKLHRLLALVPDERGSPERESVRRSLGVLHALRLALMQHMFLRAVQIPAFSRSNDISRDDVLEMVFTLRIDDAVAQLRRAFPVSSPAISDYSVSEPSDYPDGDSQAYASIQSAYIDPIEQAYALCLRIGTAIANHFGAHG